MRKVGKLGKVTRRFVMNEEMVQNSVMNEELVQNGVMNQKFVKNFVVNAKIDPKVVMDLSILKIGGWTVCNPSIKICWKNLLMRVNCFC